MAFEVTLHYGPKNNLWFSINSPDRAVSCYLRAGRARKALVRAISSVVTSTSSTTDGIELLYSIF